MYQPLIDIPLELFRSLLLAWLDLQAIVGLDTALCNRKLRKNIENSFSSLKIVSQPTKNGVICDYFAWMSKRRIPIENISVQNIVPSAGGYPTRKAQSYLAKIKKFFAKKKVFMSKWLCKLLPDCSLSLRTISVTTGDRKNAFTPELFHAIGACVQLRSVLLTKYQNLHSQQGVTSLHPIVQGCQMLEELKLFGCQFTQLDAEVISTKLTHFSHTSRTSPNLTPQAFKTLITRCTALRKISVFSLAWDALFGVQTTGQLLNAAVYELMIQNLPHLAQLRVVAFAIDCDGLEVLVISRPQMTYLSLTTCETMSAVTFAALILESSLEHLDLCGNWFLTGALNSNTPQPLPFAPASTSTPFSLIRNATSKLQHLTLQEFAALTDAGFSDLMQHCPALVTLTVMTAPLLTVAVVDSIVQHCPRMRMVSCWGCANLRAELVASRMRQLEVEGPGRITFLFGTLRNG